MAVISVGHYAWHSFFTAFHRRTHTPGGAEPSRFRPRRVCACAGRPPRRGSGWCVVPGCAVRRGQRRRSHSRERGEKQREPSAKTAKPIQPG